MKFLKKATVATAALSLVALGSIPTFATAVAADNLTFLQVLETVDNDALYESGENATADYIVSVRAVINDPALVGKKRIHEIVVKPSWKYGDADIVLSDINLHGQTANVYLAADKKSVRIDNLVDRQKVTFKIKRKPVFDSAQDKPEMLVNEVRASGEDADGNPVSAKTSQSETSCQPNKNHFGDTDACDTASIPVKVDPAEAVDAYIADPSQENYNKASDATEGVDAQRERLTDAAIAYEKLNAYRARPNKARYEGAVEATKDFPSITEQLQAAKKNIEGATTELSKGINDLTDKPARAESFKEKLLRYRNDKNVQSATEDLKNFDKSEAAKAVDDYIKRPYKKDLYEKALKATENDPAQRARLVKASKNIKRATEDLKNFDKPMTKVPEVAPVAEDKPVGVVPEKKQKFGKTYIDHSKTSNPGTSNMDEAASENDKSTGAAASENDKSTGAAASENDKSTGAAADSQKSATENEPELARTGVTAVRALAGIAALLALCGVAALRTSRKA